MGTGARSRCGNKGGGKSADKDQENAKADNDAAKAQQTDNKVSFEDLLKTNEEYRKANQAMIDKAINKRFAQSKATDETLQKLQPALRALGAKYGVDAKDTEAIIKAVTEDASLYEEAAFAKGVDVETYRETESLKAQLEEYKAREEAEKRDREANAIYDRWISEEREAQKIYPNLNIRDEIRNPDFMDMLKKGIPVKAAYQAIHFDELVSGAMQMTAQEVKAKSAAAVKSRPHESAATHAPAANMTKDPRSYTRADYDNLLSKLNRR